MAAAAAEAQDRVSEHADEDSGSRVCVLHVSPQLIWRLQAVPDENEWWLVPLNEEEEQELIKLKGMKVSLGQGAFKMSNITYTRAQASMHLSYPSNGHHHQDWLTT